MKTGKDLIGARVRLKETWPAVDTWCRETLYGKITFWGKVTGYTRRQTAPYNIHVPSWKDTIHCDRDEFTVPRRCKGGARC